MPGKTRLSSYCFLRDDDRLHEVINMRMSQRGLTHYHAGKYLGVDSSNVRKYLKNKEHAISQQKVLALAAYLDIGVEVNITVE